MNKLSPPAEDAFNHFQKLSSWKAKAVYLSLLDTRTLADLSITYMEIAQFTKELSKNAKMFDELMRITAPMRKGSVALKDMPVKVSMEQELDDASWNQ